MAIRSGFFNSVNGDRKYDASRFAEYFASFIGNGVFPNPSDCLQVISNNDMTITVRPGKAWINGYILINDDDYILEIEPADGALNRIDRIVARYDVVDREIRLEVKKGTFASNPVAPELQRDADAYELGLADIYVGNGVISISQSAIIDLRLNTELCGIVHGVVEQVDTTTLFAQYQAWYQQATGQAETDIEAIKQQFQAEFDAWFAGIKDILDESTAGNLFNLIEEHKNDTNNPHNITPQQIGAVSQEDFDAHKADYIHHAGYGKAIGVNDKTITLIPAPTEYKEGMGISFLNEIENTGEVTININELGAVPVLKSNGNPLSSGSLKAGSIYTIRYNGSNFILQGEGGEYGTAQPNHVLEGITFGTEDGLKVGTMPNRGGVNRTLTTQGGTYTIPEGYHDGTGTVKAQFANLIAENIKKGVNIGGVVGSLISVDTFGSAMVVNVEDTIKCTRSGGEDISGDIKVFDLPTNSIGFILLPHEQAGGQVWIEHGLTETVSSTLYIKLGNTTLYSKGFSVPRPTLYIDAMVVLRESSTNYAQVVIQGRQGRRDELSSFYISRRIYMSGYLSTSFTISAISTPHDFVPEFKYKLYSRVIPILG